MKSPLLRTGIILTALMFTATALAYAMRPTKKLVDIQLREKIETLIPMQFGDWHGMQANNIVLADPQMRENLSRIYTETLSRTYVDSHGRQIMLSIAYGEDQRDGMTLHYPEACYPAQGFQTKSVHKGELITPYGAIIVKRLLMVLGQRQEHVMYWTMIGDYQSFSGIDKKLNEMRYSLNGIIPDGFLFRVSTISNDADLAKRESDEFVITLLEAVDSTARKRLAGL